MSINIKRRLRDYNKPWCKKILNKRLFYTNEYQVLENEILKKTQYNRNTDHSTEWITGFTIDNLCKEVEKLIIQVDPNIPV